MWHEESPLCNPFLGFMDDIGLNNDFEYTKIFVIL